VGSRIHGMDESGVRLSYPPPLNITMKYGYYSDDEIPTQLNPGYAVNSAGYRCAEWRPMPDGKKNVVVLGCSHTFGEGLDEGEVWVDQLYTLVNQRLLRFWNLGSPGASADKIVRILYATEKVLSPKIVIVCWPERSRRERLDSLTKNLTSDNELLKTETDQTDQQTFLKNVFFAEKFAEKQGAKIFHCFAHDVYELNGSNILQESSLKSCWPTWSAIRKEQHKRIFISEPSLARDGIHYGVEHHRVFAENFYNKFKSKLK
jgi:hypothetical protein